MAPAPAEQTSLSILALMDVSGDLLPPGALNLVSWFDVGPGSRWRKAVASQRWRLPMKPIGRLIMQYASENRIPVTLELGGKSPNILFTDVMAEVCTCPSRALMHEGIYERFMERVVARTKKVAQGNPLDAGTMIGTQASEDQLDNVVCIRPTRRSAVTSSPVSGRKTHKMMLDHLSTDEQPAGQLQRECVGVLLSPHPARLASRRPSGRGPRACLSRRAGEVSGGWRAVARRGRPDWEWTGLRCGSRPGCRGTRAVRRVGGCARR